MVVRTSPAVRAPVEAPGLNLSQADVYYILFRNKWKIVFCSLLGLAAAIGYYIESPRMFKSEAKLFVRYVTESRSPVRADENSSVRSPDPYGITILNSELEIITSLDLVGKVVDAVGVKTLTPLKNDGLDRDRAMARFSGGLLADVPVHSSIIQLSFSHTDPTIVQSVLREIINQYLKKHVEIHRSSGLVDDFLTQETEQLRTRLSQTEEDLRNAKSKLGYASIDEATKTISSLSTRLRQEISNAETDQAEREAYVHSIEMANSPTVPTTETAQTPLPPDEIINAYTGFIARAGVLRKNEQDLQAQFTPESNPVKANHAQLVEAEINAKKLEADYPSLKFIAVTQPVATGQNSARPDLVLEKARLKSIQSRITVLKEQLNKLKDEANRINSMEAEVTELTRRKDLGEANYLKYASNLEQARLNEATSSGNVSNISEIQSPSSPIKAKSKRIMIVPGLAAAGVCLGIAWAFLVELYLDRTVRRPIEIERKLNLPLFLSIPVVDRSFKKKLHKSPNQEKPAVASSANGKEALSARNKRENLVTQALQPYYATLRDRLIGFCENRNITHKPKLIAVTGLAKGSGVSTTAAGVARSLSETGEGNVLLVNMNPGEDSAHHFSQGNAVPQLDDLLDNKRGAPVQDNLYVVSEGSNSERLIRNLPQRFSKMLPKLKSSDFDYIIFDMPPVSQISITPRLASFMDIVLIQIESEKTDLELVQQATTLLASSNAQLGVVLNKTRPYIPQLLHKDMDRMMLSS